MVVAMTRFKSISSFLLSAASLLLLLSTSEGSDQCLSVGESTEAVAYFEQRLDSRSRCSHVDSKPCIVVLNVSNEEYGKADLMLNLHLEQEAVVVVVSETALDVRVVVVSDHFSSSLPLVFTHKESRMVSSNAQIKVLHHILGPSDNVIEDFGPICVLASAENANRISLALTRKALRRCNESEEGERGRNDVISAFRASKQRVDTCSNAGDGNNQTLSTIVLDLANAGVASKEGSGLVYVSLVYPSLDSESQLNLVLRCNESVHWILQPSIKVSVSLAVFVESTSSINITRSQLSTVVHKVDDLPSSKEQLKDLFETYKYDGVGKLTNLKVAKANIISIKVSGSKKETEIVARQTSKEDESSTSVAQKDDDEDLKSTIEDAMIVECSQVQTIVTIERRVADLAGVKKTFLDDSSCKGQRNETHWTLKTGSTSCGSLTIFGVGRSARFRNHAHLLILHPNGESSANTTLKIPFDCSFSPSLKGSFDNDYDDNQTNDIAEMYHLHLTTQSGLNMETRSDEGHITEGEVVKVNSVFNSQIFLRLAMESCWISQDPNDDFGSSEKAVFLLENGCPSNQAMNVHWNHNEKNPSFAFTSPRRGFFSTNSDEEVNFYLFCTMGLCSPSKRVTANLAQCSNASQLCAKSRSRKMRHRPPSAQQVTRRGPIAVRKQSSQNSESSLSSSLSSSHVVMVGVPAEIAGIVAILSFVIGVCITAVLCFLHQRKNRRRKHNKDQKRRVSYLANQNNNGHLDCSELQSMLARVPNTNH